MSGTIPLKRKKNLFLKLTATLYEKLGYWQDLKPIRGLIEDFFKVCKDAFGLGEFHSYTDYVKNFVGFNNL